MTDLKPPRFIDDDGDLSRCKPIGYTNHPHPDGTKGKRIIGFVFQDHWPSIKQIKAMWQARATSASVSPTPESLPDKSSQLDQAALKAACNYSRGYYTLNQDDCVAGIILTYMQNCREESVCEHEYIGHDLGVPYCGKCGVVKLQRRPLLNPPSHAGEQAERHKAGASALVGLHPVPLGDAPNTDSPAPALSDKESTLVGAWDTFKQYNDKRLSDLDSPAPAIQPGERLTDLERAIYAALDHNWHVPESDRFIGVSSAKGIIGLEFAQYRKKAPAPSPTAPAGQVDDLSFVKILAEAEEIVKGKYLWKKWIDGTPLSNDIAVWMTEFAIAKAKQHIWSVANKINGELCDKVGALEKHPDHAALLKQMAEALDDVCANTLLGYVIKRKAEQALAAYHKAMAQKEGG